MRYTECSKNREEGMAKSWRHSKILQTLRRMYGRYRKMSEGFPGRDVLCVIIERHSLIITLLGEKTNKMFS